jgi:hypothetical protein
MAAIVETLFSDRRIELANEELLRTIPFGNNWTQLRIGIRFAVWGAHFGNTATIIPFTTFAGLTLGVCNGPQGWLTDRPKEFIGCKANVTANLWTNSAPATNPPFYTATNNSTHNVRKTSAGAVTSVGPVLTLLVSSAPHLVRNIFMVSITKGVPNCTVLAYGCTTAGQVQTDCSRAVLLTQVATTTPSASFVTTSASSTLAYASGDLTFDTVGVSWSKFYPQMEINDIAIARFY